MWRLKRKKAHRDALQETMITPENAHQEIKKLEKQMLQYARDLEFEKAAAIRDRIQQIEKQAFLT